MNKTISSKIAFGVIALLAIGLASFIWLESRNQNGVALQPIATEGQKNGADMLTYKNENKGFSLVYPSSWKVIEDTCEKTQQIAHNVDCQVEIASYPYQPGSSDPIYTNPGAPNGLMVSVIVFKNPLKMSAEEYVYSSKGLNHNREGKDATWKSSKEIIGGKEFLKEESANEYPSESDVATYYLSVNDKVIHFNGFIFAKNYDYEKMPETERKSYENTYKRVISSLKVEYSK